MLPSAQCGQGHASSGHPAHLLPVEFCLITVSVYLFFHSLSSACFLKFCPRRACRPRPSSPVPPQEQSEAPRQTRGWGAAETILCVGERGAPGGISPLVQGPPGGLSVHFPPVESGRRSPRPQARPRESQGGMRPPAFTARTWPPGAPPNSPGCASGWCCRPPE